MRKETVQRVLKWAAVALAAVVALMQFIRPALTNPPVDQTRTIQARMQVSGEVSAILDRSCNDCHSYQTRWPWYSHVAPISWFVVGHVNDGRDDLNFSEWAKYSQSEQQHFLKKMCGEVTAGEMPLNSYLWLHRDAKLSSEDVKTLCDWASAESERMSQITK